MREGVKELRAEIERLVAESDAEVELFNAGWDDARAGSDMLREEASYRDGYRSSLYDAHVAEIARLREAMAALMSVRVPPEPPDTVPDMIRERDTIIASLRSELEASVSFRSEWVQNAVDALSQLQARDRSEAELRTVLERTESELAAYRKTVTQYLSESRYLRKALGLFILEGSPSRFAEVFDVPVSVAETLFEVYK